MANETNMQALAQSLKQVRSATAELTSQMRKLNRIGRSSSKKHAAACPGGVCAAPGGGFGGAGRGAGQGPAYSRSLQGLMSTAVRNALSGDFRRTLRSMLSSIVRGITTTAGRSAGGGLGGSLVSTLVGGGLSLVLGRLFKRRQRVQVENVVRAEVLNFPRLSGLDFATNPASRLIGGRAVARGPGFVVEIDFKSGAEDIVAAKVAQRLSDLNVLHGIV
ncbi:hypothetical protein IIA79_04495 [bacterium]|nr:hypothetical protein [bacterium]